MSQGFRLELFTDEVRVAIGEGAEDAARQAAEHLLTEGNKSVPHDEGTLERSGEASAEGTRGAVSYDTPYAVRQHEDMSLSHDGKGRAKWLENTMAAEAPTVAAIAQAALRRRLGT